MQESNTWIKLLCAAVKIVIVKPDYNISPPTKGQRQYRKALPTSNTNISWNKDDIFPLSFAFLRQGIWAVLAELGAHRRSGQIYHFLSNWPFTFGNIFSLLAALLSHLTILIQWVLIPKGPCIYLYIIYLLFTTHTFNLTMTLSASIFHMMKVTSSSTFRGFHLHVSKNRCFLTQGMLQWHIYKQRLPALCYTLVHISSV